MRKTSVKGVLYLFGGLVLVLVVLMVFKQMFPYLLERFDNPPGPTGATCEPLKTPCPEGQFCQNKMCYHVSTGPT